MSSECGPYLQMGKLAQQLANHFQKDPNLALEPLLAHFMEEVEVNLAADTFDHAGFIQRIQNPLKIAANATGKPRRKQFLLAMVDALNGRMEEVQGGQELNV
ncbi:hypothetical protein E2F50_06365 [Rhizobium deserti]|uniref:Uncharacterized protein n=2 Tax=Rhizobium deserti TaxID=2547961 RepID=A0A4R5UPS0_9HYPH|nr:hypothetical protein [Rhizobium deserti]TDK39828.1 hypothetical protein E2F50_06365 [Rhizobium deserti]